MLAGLVRITWSHGLVRFTSLSVRALIVFAILVFSLDTGSVFIVAFFYLALSSAPPS